MSHKKEIPSKKHTRFKMFSSEVNKIIFTRTHFKNIESTQDYLHAHADELFKNSDAVVITANAQTKGRGTHGRPWISPANVNIYASFGLILRQNPEKLEQIKKEPITTQIAALAVAKTLEEFNLTPKIKWRNDLLLNSKKVGGILCEPLGDLKDGRKGVVIGIGLNVNMSKKDCHEMIPPVTSMTIEANHSFSKEEVFRRLQLHLSFCIRLYLKCGSIIFHEKISKLFDSIGQTISVQDENSKQIFKGKFQGINHLGHLILKLENGSTQLIQKGCILKAEKLNDVRHTPVTCKL